jgi:biotin carboxylase
VSNSSKQTLLILAASHYQCDAIRAARALGYRVVTTDNRPDNPGHRLADRSYDVDTTDRDGVLAIARTEKIAGVLAPCTDVAMPTAAFVAAAFGLRGPSTESAAIACDKIRFRAFLEAREFAVPKWHRPPACGQGGGLFHGASRWIVKPAQSSGSKGIVVVSSEGELRAALPTACAFSKSGEAIVEAYLDGHQGTLEGWLHDGDISWHTLLDRETAPLPHRATHGHATPSVLTAHQQAGVLETAARLWRALGVGDGPFDCDFVIQGDTVFILEVSPRLGGNAICELVRSAFAFDLVTHTVRWACGEAVELPSIRDPKPRAVVLLGSPRAGRLRYHRKAAATLAREPWVESLEWDVDFDMPVEPFIDGRHRVGQCLVAAPDRAELGRRIREVRERLNVTAE